MNKSRLAALRNQAQLTIGELAERAKLDESFIRRLESGQRRGSSDALRQIADALANLTGKSVGDVMKELTDPE